MGGHINLDVTRRLASYSKRKWSEIRNDEKKKVAFFRHGDDFSEVRRLIVYYTRGILCLSIRREGKSETEFFYRKDCNVMILAKLLEGPEGYKELGFKANSFKSGCIQTRPRLEVDITEAGEFADLEEHLKAVEDQLEDLKVYRARIQYRIKKSKKEKKDDDGEKGGHLWVRSFVCKDVQNELEQIKMSELKCITLTPDGKGVVYTEKDGECYWTSPIGWDLGEELKKSTKDRYPITINMGTEERYFIKYSNGDVMVHGNEELKEFVKIGDVKMIAFGIEFDSFAVLYEDGGSAWSFVPKALRCLLANRPGNKDPKVDFVSIGQANEYFVRMSDYTIKYGNIKSGDMQEALDKCPGAIREVTFGKGDCFIARFKK